MPGEDWSIVERAVKSKPDLLATLRAQIWNTAIEAAALVVQPVPHVNEERTCKEVARQIRNLKVKEPEENDR